ncbi:MAG: hybrid sensor histidine kinase/response regulator [Armatimonadota bacterium]|nr:hybrid sensor histidine kinase/response regulator [Armatimonadota bacterium]MDR7426654.1 hybrid sensor histidine kinase/response regulator [Armatimonadota bacterium]MDR7463663.1 hybrid sensor histidine kinase/response regulator [Armatimonadota bacterium]MDR7468674.1 hybrid sensor histidine kinase/response regulator [Armatimonadota bacterium]MDR7473797.1 hybrid sensor histidine kinase/response regulator [Armatimonadota bacterium]
MEVTGRILIVDDEEIVLDSCSEILRAAGYAVATASDGAQGLRQVEEFRPDLVYLDLKMPGMSGMEVLERIRAADPSVVTIVVTGYATLASAVEAMQRGAYDFVPKPFTPEELRLITRRGLERRRLVQETMALRREQEMLREHFAAIIAHEVKSPLAAVQQSLYLLAAELREALTEAQRERLARLQARLADLLQMVDTWLRAISVDLRGIRERFRPTAVADLVARAVEAVQPFARRKDLQIGTALPEGLPPVVGDEVTLVQALVNLLHNAVKYSYPGGSITVAARVEGEQVHIGVSDQGVGIPPDELPHIFGAFYRGRAGMAGEVGAGLGLAVTRKIVEAHGGVITAESTPGKGSTFTVALPVAGQAGQVAVGLDRPAASLEGAA